MHVVLAFSIHFLACARSLPRISVYVDFPSTLFPHTHTDTSVCGNRHHAAYVSYISIMCGIHIFRRKRKSVCVRKQVLFLLCRSVRRFAAIGITVVAYSSYMQYYQLLNCSLLLYQLIRFFLLGLNTIFAWDFMCICTLNQ